MKLFEFSFLLLRPVYPGLYRKVRGLLVNEVCRYRGDVSVLDIGGRKSHYTIGIGANVTISDLPRKSGMQSTLSLGVNQKITEHLRNRRSNVRYVAYDDMSRTCFKENSFDIIVCVEGLEHVEEDELFIKNVFRILKKGGLLLMTTPHGDYVPNRIPDHKRHYSKAQLHALLHKYFDSVETWGDVRGDRFHRWGLREWSLRHPYWILKSMIGNLLNCYQPITNKGQEYKTQHLFARC
ncbi:MAG: class I SAM-dependent methyltransferase [Nitrospirales bacterium]|nr:class I SAM-dependent methyltransferase [Nitrospirales bacterium]